MRRFHGKAAFAGLAIAIASAAIAASAAFAAVSPDVRAVWSFVPMSDPGLEDGPYRLRAIPRGVDDTDPWSGARASVPSSADPSQGFHHARPLDESDPWTGEPLPRVTPALRPR